MAVLVAATIAGVLLGSTEPRLGATTASGAYLVLTFLAFCGLLVWACAITHLPEQREHVDRM
jgi:hypothetical protein